MYVCMHVCMYVCMYVGFAAVRKKRNEVLEVTEAGSAKYERKAMKEQKKWLDDLETKFVGGEEVRVCMYVCMYVCFLLIHA
jgi:hypothetical protein